MVDMKKKSGPLIIQRHIFCIGNLINMKKFLFVLWKYGPDPLFLSIALRAQCFIIRLLIPAETMAYVLF